MWRQDLAILSQKGPATNTCQLRMQVQVEAVALRWSLEPEHQQHPGQEAPRTSQHKQNQPSESFLGDWKLPVTTSAERQKRSLNLAPVLVIISGTSLAFSRKIITSTGFYRFCAAGVAAPVLVKNQSPNSLIQIAIRSLKFVSPMLPHQGDVVWAHSPTLLLLPSMCGGAQGAGPAPVDCCAWTVLWRAVTSVHGSCYRPVEAKWQSDLPSPDVAKTTKLEAVQAGDVQELLRATTVVTLASQTSETPCGNHAEPRRAAIFALFSFPLFPWDCPFDSPPVLEPLRLTHACPVLSYLSGTMSTKMNFLGSGTVLIEWGSSKRRVGIEKITIVIIKVPDRKVCVGGICFSKVTVTISGKYFWIKRQPFRQQWYSLSSEHKHLARMSREQNSQGSPTLVNFQKAEQKDRVHVSAPMSPCCESPSPLPRKSAQTHKSWTRQSCKANQTAESRRSWTLGQTVVHPLISRNNDP